MYVSACALTLSVSVPSAPRRHRTHLCTRTLAHCDDSSEELQMYASACALSHQHFTCFLLNRLTDQLRAAGSLEEGRLPTLQACLGYDSALAALLALNATLDQFEDINQKV